MRSLNYLRTIALFMSVLIISLPIALASELNLVYDSNGNLVTGDSFYREYNELNQLSVVREGNSSSGTVLQEYTWHPVQERILVKRTYESGSLKEKIIYVNDNFVKIINSSGEFEEVYVKQDGILVAQKDTDGNKQAIHPDHLGSVDTITDVTGAVIQNNFFSPFGEPIEEGNSRFGYEGKEFDEQTQDTDFHFRKYRSEWGRFTQPDTLIPDVYNPQSLNRYVFELNNPFKNVDPDGHTPAVLGGIFGGPVGVAIAIAISIVLTKVIPSYLQSKARNKALEAMGQDPPGFDDMIILDNRVSENADLANYERTEVLSQFDVEQNRDGVDPCQWSSSDFCNEKNLEEPEDPKKEDPNGELIAPIQEDEDEEDDPSLNGGGGGSAGSGGNPGFDADCEEVCEEDDEGNKSCKWVCTT